jgi:uncharacterized glyoxalase superfamily protein PhnB
MKNTPAGWPRISVSIFYDDALQAIDWLCRAFGRAGGAKIDHETSLHDYGEDYWADRSYGVRDLEQHQWWFTQRVRDPIKK